MWGSAAPALFQQQGQLGRGPLCSASCLLQHVVCRALQSAHAVAHKWPAAAGPAAPTSQPPTTPLCTFVCGDEEEAVALTCALVEQIKPFKAVKAGAAGCCKGAGWGGVSRGFVEREPFNQHADRKLRMGVLVMSPLEGAHYGRCARRPTLPLSGTARPLTTPAGPLKNSKIVELLGPPWIVQLDKLNCRGALLHVQHAARLVHVGEAPAAGGSALHAYTRGSVCRVVHGSAGALPLLGSAGCMHCL